MAAGSPAAPTPAPHQHSVTGGAAPGPGDGAGGADEVEAALEPFARPGFDAKRMVREFLRQNAVEAARPLSARLAESRAVAADALQRKVARQQPLLVQAAGELRAMEGTLGALRRNLGKTEFVLAGIEGAAQRLAAVRVVEAGASPSASSARPGEPDGARAPDSEGGAGIASAPGADEQKNARRLQLLLLQPAELSDQLDVVEAGHDGAEAVAAQARDLSRFKQAHALLGPLALERQWLLDAPDKLQLLLHQDALAAAVALINSVADADGAERGAASSSAKQSSGGPAPPPPPPPPPQPRSQQQQQQQQQQQPQPPQQQQQPAQVAAATPYGAGGAEELQWALAYARRAVMRDARALVGELITMLESNQSVSSRHVVASFGGAAVQPGATPRRRASSAERPRASSQSLLAGGQQAAPRGKAPPGTPIGEGGGKSADDEVNARGRRASNHPARLLRLLGMEDTAVRAFLGGRRALLKRVSDEIINSPLASEPEQCVLQLAQSVLHGVLETNLEFRALFAPAGGGSGSAGVAAADPVLPDAQLSCVLVWNHDQMARFTTNFVRFLLPGCIVFDELGPGASLAAGAPAPALPRPSQASPVSRSPVTRTGSASGDNSEEPGAGAASSSAAALGADAAEPFESEVPDAEAASSVALNNDEWRALGSCLRWTLLLCRRLDKDGVHLAATVARQLRAPLGMALESVFAQAERNLRLALQSEAWVVEKLRVESRDAAAQQMLVLSASGQRMYELLHDLIRKVKRVVSSGGSGSGGAALAHSSSNSNNNASTRADAATTTNNNNGAAAPPGVTGAAQAALQLEPRVIRRVQSIVKAYLDNLVHAAGAWPATLDGSRDKFEETVLRLARRGESYRSIVDKLGASGREALSRRERRVVSVLMSEPYSTAQLLAMVADALFVSTDLLGRVREQLERLFRRALGLLRALEAAIGSIENEQSPWRLLCDAFVTRYSLKLLEDVLQWSQLDYQSARAAAAPLGISPNFERLAKALTELKAKALTQLGGHGCALDIVASVSEHILVKLENDGTPQAIFGPVEGEHNKARLRADLGMLVNLTQEMFQREPSDQSQELLRLIVAKTGAAPSS